jgi:hypothetical protein
MKEYNDILSALDDAGFNDAEINIFARDRYFKVLHKENGRLDKALGEFQDIILKVNSAGSKVIEAIYDH